MTQHIQITTPHDIMMAQYQQAHARLGELLVERDALRGQIARLSGALAAIGDLDDDAVSAQSPLIEAKRLAAAGLAGERAEALAKNAKWAETMPDREGDTRYWAVGKHTWDGRAPGPIVTAITVQRDMPGPCGPIDRVCIWCGDTLAAEGPLHAMQSVGYEVLS